MLRNSQQPCPEVGKMTPIFSPSDSSMVSSTSRFRRAEAESYVKEAQQFAKQARTVLNKSSASKQMNVTAKAVAAPAISKLHHEPAHRSRQSARADLGKSSSCKMKQNTAQPKPSAKLPISSALVKGCPSNPTFAAEPGSQSPSERGASRLFAQQDVLSNHASDRFNTQPFVLKQTKLGRGDGDGDFQHQPPSIVNSLKDRKTSSHAAIRHGITNSLSKLPPHIYVDMLEHPDSLGMLTSPPTPLTKISSPNRLKLGNTAPRYFEPQLSELREVEY